MDNIKEIQNKENIIEDAISKAVPVYTKQGIKKLINKVFLIHKS